ncbi:hypothetical protein BU15DRAFT_81179 [Melanogaster broomeanus]|nr:hypothetical protein BU15DRAFT_81179 [Melanogaster broomeanus]
MGHRSRVQKICALLTQRNALSPVSRLPPDVLATIFLYQAYSFYRDPRYSGTWGAPPWANVSYICRHWRDVALNTSFLWSFLFVSTPRWTEELLSRTTMLPLRIRINVEHWDREEMIFLEQVTTDVTRIQDLSLELPRNLAVVVFSKLSTPAPLLHTSRLFVTQTGAESRLVPDALFSREMPALRVLELYHCHVPWSSPIFTALTSLRLRDIASSSQPTITELLAMLRHIPDLAHLYLENALPGAEDTLNSQHCLLSECLDLPHLSLLALVAPFSTVVVFLSNVTAPLKTEIRLCCRRDVFTASYPPLYPLLERTIQQRIRRRASDPYFEYQNYFTRCWFCPQHIGTRLWCPFYSECGQYDLDEDWVRGITLKLDIELNLRKDREELVGDIFRIIPMVHLHTLAHLASTGIGNSLSSLFLETTFGNLQELRFIKLIQLQVDDWITALSRGSCKEEYGVSDAEYIFAPALAALRISAATLGYSCHPRSRECSGSLHRALVRRKAKGYALKKLVIAGSSYVSHDQVEELREVVDEVDWDGYTQASDGTSDSDGDDQF